MPGYIFKISASVGPGTQIVEYYTDQNVDAPIFYVDGREFLRSPE